MDSEKRVEQKCVCKDCMNRGIPADGFDFFACDDCLDELDRCLKFELHKRIQRHYNN
jgi:hypothetical protein